MLATLMLLLAVPTSPLATPPDSAHRTDAPIRVSLNSDGHYLPGDRARIHVQMVEDGYLVVLRTDVDGWVRVVYPVNPTDDNFVRGGHKIEIRGRGDREAFTTGSASGTGTIIAARATESFHFDRFMRNNHWDYRVLDSMRAGSDQEAALVDVVQRMAGDVQFDYDAAPYSVDERAYAYRGHPAYFGAFGSVPYGWNIGVGYGYGYGFGYDPFFYDPFFYGYGPFFGGPFIYGRSCFGFRFCGGRFGGFGRPFVPLGGFYRPRAQTGLFVSGGLGYRPRQAFGSGTFQATAAARLGVRGTGVVGAGSAASRAPADRGVATDARRAAPNAPAAQRAPQGVSQGRRAEGSGGGGGRSYGGGGRSSGGGRSAGGGGRSAGGGGGRRR